MQKTVQFRLIRAALGVTGLKSIQEGLEKTKDLAPLRNQVNQVVEWGWWGEVGGQLPVGAGVLDMEAIGVF